MSEDTSWLIVYCSNHTAKFGEQFFRHPPPCSVDTIQYDIEFSLTDYILFDDCQNLCYVNRISLLIRSNLTAILRIDKSKLLIKKTLFDSLCRIGARPAVLFWFEQRLLRILGLAPQLRRCTATGTKATPARFPPLGQPRKLDTRLKVIDLPNPALGLNLFVEKTPCNETRTSVSPCSSRFVESYL